MELSADTKMNKSIKAALLSALVYPGMGHFFLKKYAISAVITAAFSVPLYSILSGVITKTKTIIEKVENGEIPFDIHAIRESLSSSVLATDGQELNIYMYAIIVIWVIAIVDSYRLGRTKL